MKRHIFDKQHSNPTEVVLIAQGLVGIALAIVVGCAVKVVAGESELEVCRRIAEKYNAQTEVVLDDHTRVDLLSPSYAIEVDRASKWAEAIGQSLYYALKTKRKPAIILLVEDTKAEAAYIERCRLVCDRYGIQLYLEPID